MRYFPLIWAAVCRKPGEAILIGLSVSAGFTLFALMLALHASYREIVNSARNDRLITDPRFPIPKGLRLPMGMRSEIAQIKGVTAVGALYQLRGYYRDPHDGARILAADQAMQHVWSESPVSARDWKRLTAEPDGLLVSHKVALRLHLKPGEVLPLITPPGVLAHGAKYLPFRVLAIVPDPTTNIYGVILGNLRYVEDSRPSQDRGYVTEFRIAIADAARANVTSLTIDQRFANSGTPTITIPEKTNAANAVRSGTSTATVTLPVAGAGLFMILLLVANGIAQSVRERVPEFAVLQAVGFRARTLTALVFAEAAIPCLIGALVGTASAAVLTRWAWQYLPHDLTGGIPIPRLSGAVLGWAVLSAAVLALASAAAPIQRLRRISVTEALAGR
jgi:putative ABC transport system permease protein